MGNSIRFDATNPSDLEKFINSFDLGNLIEIFPKNTYGIFEFDTRGSKENELHETIVVSESNLLHAQKSRLQKHVSQRKHFSYFGLDRSLLGFAYDISSKTSFTYQTAEEGGNRTLETMWLTMSPVRPTDSNGGKQFHWRSSPPNCIHVDVQAIDAYQLHHEAEFQHAQTRLFPEAEAAKPFASYHDEAYQRRLSGLLTQKRREIREKHAYNS